MVSLESAAEWLYLRLQTWQTLPPGDWLQDTLGQSPTQHTDTRVWGRKNGAQTKSRTLSASGGVEHEPLAERGIEQIRKPL